MKKEPKEIWVSLDSDRDKKTKYLITRTVQALKDQSRQEAKVIERKKEQLIANMSGQVINYLLNQEKSAESKDQLRSDWMECLSDITKSWNNRSPENNFFKEAQQHWKIFCEKNPDFKPDSKLHTSAEEEKTGMDKTQKTNEGDLFYRPEC